MTSHAFAVQELSDQGDMWLITLRGCGSAQLAAKWIWPPSGLAPHPVTLTEEIMITEPEVAGTFEIRGLTPEAFRAMDPGFAALFREQGFDPEAVPAGKYRVWYNNFTESIDYDAAEFAERYIDNFTYFEIQPDVVFLGHTIDQQTLKVRLANGIVFPAMRNSGITYDQLNCPRLNSLRADIGRLLYEVEKDRLMLAYITAAFADIGTIASGGGDPGIYDRVMEKARAAQRLAGGLTAIG